MATIGSCSLAIDNKIDSGLAQLLIKLPKHAHEISHKGATFRTKPDSLYCVCLFAGAKSYEESVSIGTPIIQECLDILSMTGEEDLATRDYTDEYLVWWLDDGKNVFSYISTMTLSFSLGNATVIIQDKYGNIVPQTEKALIYSDAFRYYRLAQISDDLFDSYRNMYLAFESFLSTVYPKGKELEINWLKNSLSSSESSLRLNNLIPPGTTSAVDYIVDTIYLNARLPLFHSKQGKTKVIPTILSDRIGISKALNLLTKIVIQMSETWYSCSRKSGWINLKFIEEYYNKVLINSKFVYSDNSNYTMDDDLESISIKQGTKFESQYKDRFMGEYRPNIHGHLEISATQGKGPLYVIFVINEKSVQFVSSPESFIDLTGFNRLEITLFLRGYNASQPKSLFSR